MGIFLDIDGAFNRVWVEGLKFKLLDYKLPNNYAQLLSNFLDSRNFRIKMGQHKSDSIFLEAGTPQGSILSPIMFLLFINDFPVPHSNIILISQYADDICLWASSKIIPIYKKEYRNIYMT